MDDQERRLVQKILKALSQQTEKILKYIKELKIGGEDNSINANNQKGMWAGARDFDSAPFRVYLNGDAYLGGSLKTAIVPTNKGYAALYCMESPEVWFMDFCYGQSPEWWEFWKDPKVHYDPIFLIVTEPPYHVVPTVDKNWFQVYGKRKGYVKNRFEKKTKEEFEANNKLWSK